MKTSNKFGIIIMLNSFIRNILLLILCPDVIRHLVLILSTLKSNQQKELITREYNVKSEYVWFVFTATYVESFSVLFPICGKVLNFTFTSLVFVVLASRPANFMVGYNPPQCCNCQCPGCHSLCKRRITFKGCRQLIYVFWQKSRQLIPGVELKLQHACVAVAGVRDLK